MRPSVHEVRSSGSMPTCTMSARRHGPRKSLGVAARGELGRGGPHGHLSFEVGPDGRGLPPASHRLVHPRVTRRSQSSRRGIRSGSEWLRIIEPQSAAVRPSPHNGLVPGLGSDRRRGLSIHPTGRDSGVRDRAPWLRRGFSAPVPRHEPAGLGRARAPYSPSRPGDGVTLSGRSGEPRLTWFTPPSLPTRPSDRR